MIMNQAIKVDKYTLPLVENIFASLGGITIFRTSNMPTFKMELKGQGKGTLHAPLIHIKDFI